MVANDDGGFAVAVIRLWLFVLAAQVVFYVLLRMHIRSGQVERLENRWDARHPDQAGNTAARRAFIAKAMVGFNRARLAGLVFVLPTLAVVVIVILVNWQ